MKYSIGDKVKIKSIDWYKQMLAIPNKSNEFLDICCGSYIFTRDMCRFCDSIMTIKEVREDYYIMREDMYNRKFTDEMIEDVVIPVVVPKFKVGDEIVKKDSISNSYLVSSVGKDYYGLSLPYPNNGVGVLPVKDQDEWELLSGSKVESEIVEKPSLIDFKDILNNEFSLPDGYEFRDGDGNLIAVDKIVLAKKGVRYPSTPKECCEVLNTEETYMGIGGHNGKLLEKFQRLLICRDAYWKIAGEEMGLGKSWKPDWEKLSTNLEYIIIKKGRFYSSSRVLVFPTAEMRDAFYEAFKELIEKCKELL